MGNNRARSRRSVGTVLLVIALLAVGAFAIYVIADRPQPVSASGESPQLPEPTPSETPEPTLDTARALFASGEPIKILVLGDSTGNDPGEWVDVWAQMLGSTGRVRLHAWQPDPRVLTGEVESGDFPSDQPDAGAWSPSPTTYGKTGRRIDIWNLSEPGGRANYAVDKLDGTDPGEPDLVLYSFGHNQSNNDIASEIEETRDEIRILWQGRPTEVVIEQNPGIRKDAEVSERTRAALRSWALRAGLPLIDIAQAFEAVGPESLMGDDYHPNAEGSKLWAATMQQALVS